MQLAPAPGCTGIELLRADTFDLHCFQTLTGTKFLVVVEPDTPDVDALLNETCATPVCSPVMLCLSALTLLGTSVLSVATPDVQDAKAAAPSTYTCCFPARVRLCLLVQKPAPVPAVITPTLALLAYVSAYSMFMQSVCCCARRTMACDCSIRAAAVSSAGREHEADAGSACCRVYDLYADFVLKNPFYEVEMPIRCELFDQHLFSTIAAVHRRWGLVH